MSLGVHFALKSEDVTSLLAAPDDDSRISFLEEQIEERYFMTPEYVAESDAERAIRRGTRCTEHLQAANSHTNQVRIRSATQSLAARSSFMTTPATS